jgi:hypothetical protein
MTLSKWLRQADVDDGTAAGKTTGESAELRELRRRNRLLSRKMRCCAGRRPICRSRICRVLKLGRQPYYRRLANRITEAEPAEAYGANALFDAHRDQRRVEAGARSLTFCGATSPVPPVHPGDHCGRDRLGGSDADFLTRPSSNTPTSRTWADVDGKSQSC